MEKETKTKMKVNFQNVLHIKPKYTHTAKGNTIISLYIPEKLLAILDEKRNKSSRSVFVVDILTEKLGVNLDD